MQNSDNEKELTDKRMESNEIESAARDDRWMV